jgi:hypothetical protein
MNWRSFKDGDYVQRFFDGKAASGPVSSLIPKVKMP